MITRILRCSAALFALAFLPSACGGDRSNAPGSGSSSDDAPAAAARSEDAPAARGDRGAAAGEQAAGPVPVVHFAAYGPQPYTWGPPCADGLEQSPSNVFRVTVPESWTFRSSSGGTGIHTLGFDTQAGRVVLDMFVSQDVFQLAHDYQALGPSGTTVDIEGTSFPLTEVTIGGRQGFGIPEITYIEGIPRRGPMTGGVLLTSETEGGVDATLAAEVLGSVRVERCGAIAQLFIWGPASGYQLVPEFDGGDPLGKELPPGGSPAFVPGESPLLTWSEEQVAYLLPLEAEVAQCVAPLVRADAASDPILHMKALTPSGTMKDVLAGYVERCT